MRTVGLLTSVFLLPVLVFADSLVNINTADATLLDTLPGIGPSKAAAIVDYRTQHGLFARIDDIQNVTGIGPSTYAGLAPFITVGTTGTSAEVASSSPATSLPATASTTPTTPVAASGGPAEYLPIPVLRIVTSGDRTVSSGAETAFSATVYDNKGNKRDDSIITWSFGDGMQRTGASVFHTYYEPGEYAVVVHAKTADGGDAIAESITTVKDAAIQISSISARGITLVNNGTRTLDLSFWKLSMGGQTFTIPADTEILAAHTVLFPEQVLELPVADAALLLYPSGEVAATYPVSAPATISQPSSAPVSYINRQPVEPITSQTGDVPRHDTAVTAPAAATSLAAAGAALQGQEGETNALKKGIFNSPWTLGFLGVVLASGGAFILL